MREWLLNERLFQIVFQLSKMFRDSRSRLSSCSPALHPLLRVFLETVGVVIPPGVAGPEVENAVVMVAAPSGVADPWVALVAVLFVVGL
jgi:hypothetical protein